MVSGSSVAAAIGVRDGAVTAGCAPVPPPPGPLFCVVVGGGRRGEDAWRSGSQHGGCAAVAVTWESRLYHGGCRGHGWLAGRVTAGVGGSAVGRPVGPCGEGGAVGWGECGWAAGGVDRGDAANG